MSDGRMNLDVCISLRIVWGFNEIRLEALMMSTIF